MLIVEDGTAVAGAEAYCAVDFADAYLDGLGFALWSTMSTTEKEQALRRATLYMLGAYRPAWAGYRAFAAQVLDWPREMVPLRDGPGGWGFGQTYLASNVVPLEVRQACAKMAYKAAAGDLAPDQGQTKLRVKVGPIETQYAPGSTAAVRFREIDALLGPLLKGGGAGSNSVSVVRS